MIRSVAFAARPGRERLRAVLRLLPPALFLLALIALAAAAGAQPWPEIGAVDPVPPPASPRDSIGQELQALLAFLLVAVALALGLGWAWRKP